MNKIRLEQIEKTEFLNKIYENFQEEDINILIDSFKDIVNDKKRYKISW
jgi:RNA binding exosome subunit